MKKYFIQGHWYKVSQIAEMFNISSKSVRNRLKKGWKIVNGVFISPSPKEVYVYDDQISNEDYNRMNKYCFQWDASSVML